MVALASPAVPKCGLFSIEFPNSQFCNSIVVTELVFKYLWTVRLFVPKAVAISATVSPFARKSLALVGSALVVPFRRPL